MKRLILLLVTIVCVSMLWAPPWENPHEMVFWDYEDTLEPEFVDSYIMHASEIRISEGQIEFMDGTDGGNRLIGFAADTLWTTDVNYDRNDPPVKYIEYSFRPRWNYAVHFDSFEFRFGRNEVGPRGVVVEMLLNDNHLLENPILLEPEIESEDPNSLDEYVLPISGAIRFSGPEDFFKLRLYPIGAIDDDDYDTDTEELIFWDFQNTLAPLRVDPHIRDVSNVSVSEGTIEFMEGADGGNSRIGFSENEDWTTDTTYDRTNPPDGYLEYSFRPDGDESLNLESFEFRYGRNEVGPRAVVVEMFINGNHILNNPVLLEPEIASENPDDLDEYVIDIAGQPIRFRGSDQEFALRMYPIGAIDDDDVDEDPKLMMNNFRVNGYIGPVPTLMMNNFRVNGFIGTVPAIALLMDRTGSMGDFGQAPWGGSNYWPAAVTATQAFVENVMIDLDAISVISYDVPDLQGDPEDFAVVEFEMLNDAGRLSQLWYETTVPDSVVTRDQVLAAIENIDDPEDGRTSLGAPILAGIDELADAYQKKPGKASMIMMTDGLDNWAPFARDVILEPGVRPDTVQINTIAFGPRIDLQLMQWIAGSTGGIFLYQPDADDLVALYSHIYFTGVLEFYENVHSSMANIASYERQTHDVIVDEHTQQIKFLMMAPEAEYDQGSTPIDFTLISPSGVSINAQDAMEKSWISYNEGFASKSYELWFPETGVWQLVINGNSIEDEQRYFSAAYASTSLRMHFEYGEEEYRVDDPITFRVNLGNRSNPVSGTQVRAEVTLPEEDMRNSHYSNVEGTPFAEYEPEKTINRRIGRTRNPGDPVIVNLNEVQPGVYEGVFTDTGNAGAYNIEIIATADNDDYHFTRRTISTQYVAPPEPLGIPYLAQPSDNAENVQAEEVNFVWSNVIDADSYHFQLATIQEIILDIDDVENNNIAIDSLDYQTDYIWRVKAKSGEEESFWSQIYSFKTGLPELPTPHSLKGEIQDNAVKLTWESPPEELDYYGPLYTFTVFKNDLVLRSLHPSVTEFVDYDLRPGQMYRYYVKANYGADGGWRTEASNVVEIRFTGIDEDGMPLVTAIQGNYPNPFNPETTIEFSVSEPAMTELSIYNIAGQRVRTLVNDNLEPGNHSVVWNSRDDRDNPVTSGIYFIKMESGDYIGHRKILFLK